MGAISSGLYQTACEASPYRQKIDIWINEGKANLFISRELAKLGEKISDKSIAKYRKYREEFIHCEMEKDPVYQGKLKEVNQTFIDKVGQIKEVDVLGHLSDVIETCADMIQDAKDRDVQVKTAQDMRFMQMTLLDAIKIYGDTMLKAQKFAAVQQNPELLKPSVINVNIKSILTDALKEAMANGNGYELIDSLRAGIRNDDSGGHERDPMPDRSSIMDGASEDIKG